MSGISLSGTEAWRVDDRLDPGTYLAKPTSVERGESSGNNPQVIVDWRVQAGDWKGAEQRDWITITEASMGRVVQVLDACEIAVPSEEFTDHGAVADWLAKQLEGFGGVVEMVVRNEPWTDKEGNQREGPKIKGYRKPDPGSDLDNDSSGFASGPQTAGKGDLPF